MAEAHSAVAFSFTVTHEGVDVNLDHDALKAVWNSGIHSWKKRLGRAKVCRHWNKNTVPYITMVFGFVFF